MTMIVQESVTSSPKLTESLSRAQANEDMTTRYTDAEWASIIADAEEQIRVFELPRKGSRTNAPDVASTIDHTLLKIEATGKQIDALCSEARVAGFASVCVRPNYVSQAVANMKGSGVKIACVIGFPEGTHDLYYKMQETRHAVRAGAHELDIVINWPELQEAKYNSIYNELATLRAQAPPPITLKSILETSQLSRSQIIAGCAIAAAANFDFVKASTGFSGHGATVEHVRSMAAACDVSAAERTDGWKMMVKASGGIRTLEDAVSMSEAGASRSGTSGGVWIVKEAKENLERSVSPPSVKSGLDRPGLTTRMWTDY